MIIVGSFHIYCYYLSMMYFEWNKTETKVFFTTKCSSQNIKPTILFIKYFVFLPLFIESTLKSCIT